MRLLLHPIAELPKAQTVSQTPLGMQKHDLKVMGRKSQILVSVLTPIAGKKKKKNHLDKELIPLCCSKIPVAKQTQQHSTDSCVTTQIAGGPLGRMQRDSLLLQAGSRERLLCFCDGGGDDPPEQTLSTMDGPGGCSALPHGFHGLSILPASLWCKQLNKLSHRVQCPCSQPTSSTAVALHPEHTRLRSLAIRLFLPAPAQRWPDFQHK